MNANLPERTHCIVDVLEVLLRKLAKENVIWQE